MTREEIVKSLRICSGGNDCGIDCVDNLMKAAADMLEADEMVLFECVKPEIKKAAKVISSLWDLLKESMAFQPKKSADEMFKELGYIKTKQKDGEYVVYENESEFLRIEIDLKYNVVAKYKYGVENIFDFSEIRAVCKLLDEMEVK